MSEMANLIKSLASNQIQSEQPTMLVFGTAVTGHEEGKITVRISQKMVLTEDFLIFSNLRSRSSITKGESLILLRQWGGQKFLVLGGVES